ncbi:MAG: PaaX family transcriptional regulator C-terminal domain-containing protein [Acidimicrobiia bacterium]
MVQSRNTTAAPVLVGEGGRPLSARSVMASLLLGRRPARAAGRDLVRWCELFGIAPGTARVALHRMTAAGELRRVDAAYELTGRLARRQEEQQTSLRPELRRWDGTWRMGVAVAPGPRPAAVRAELRAALRRSRLAEWRAGVWIRPRNLELLEDPRCAWLDVRPDDDPATLAADLFAPARWSRDAAEAIARLDAATPALRADPERAIAPAFVAGAIALRHVRADPLLPAQLLPADWPGAALRRSYATFEREFHAVARDWFRRGRSA